VRYRNKDRLFAHQGNCIPRRGASPFTAKTALMMDHSEVERLEGVAERYDSADDYDRHFQEFFGAIVGAELAGKDVLDLGCSSGITAAKLVEHVGSLDLVDGSQIYLDRARAHLPKGKTRFFCSLFEDFKPDRTYDAIVASHVLEHVNDPVAIMKTAKAWLKPDGVFYAFVPNAHSIHRYLGVTMGLTKHVQELSARDHLIGHRRVYTPAMLSDDVRAAGFEHGPLRGINCKPFTNAMMGDLPAEMIQGFLKVGTLVPQNASDIYYECRLPFS
jgi:2-polyprenyl-3-methyl-5-hydroxy-6-metoxy-1,4-benzoquinol methylase